MLNLLRRLWKDEEGQGLVEYGLIIGLVAILLIAALTALSEDGLQPIFERITGALEGAAAE